MIPKRIHYCWLSDNPLPAKARMCMESWRKKLSGYEFIKWDFNRFDKNQSKWVADAFDNGMYAFAADYIRAYALYHYGGIYLDLDVEVLKDFNDLLDAQYMLAYENEKSYRLEAACIGAEKNSVLMKKMLEYYDENSFVKNDGTFSVVPISLIMANVLRKAKIEVEIRNWHYFTNKSLDTGEILTTEGSYAVHHFEGSWLSATEKEEMVLSQEMTKKYGIAGKTACRIKKYFLHPVKLVEKIKENIQY